MGAKAVKEGAEFGQMVLARLRGQGVARETAAIFYCASIGVQMGNVAAHIGKDAALAILDVIRAEITTLPDKTTH